MLAETTTDRALVIRRVFDAPREAVWNAFTDSEQALNWWGPRDHPARHIEIDARVGGRWRICLRSVADGRDLWHGGVFREVVRPERLSFTFAWDDEGERGEENIVTITFAEQGGKTLMTFHQAPFWSDGERDGHQGGWGSTFDRLDDLLKTQGGLA